MKKDRRGSRRAANALLSNSQFCKSADRHGTEPGGYLQWNDVDIDAQYLARTPESSHSAMKPTEDMMALMSKPRSSSAFKYVLRLPSFRESSSSSLVRGCLVIHYHR